jgi:protein phosphatase
LKLAAGTHPGCRHEENQDHYRAGRLSDDTYWIVLCDGMGGASSGGKASAMAVEFLAENIEKRLPDMLSEKEVEEFMLDVVSRCNTMILQHSQSPEEPITMGTTLVMAIVRGNVAQFVHAGDSRAYVLQKNSFKQITHDHSIVQELLDSGKITQEQAYNHPNKNIITSALGVDANTRIDYNEAKLGKGDVVVVCTDGLTNMVKDSAITAMIRETDFFRVADRLIESAVEAGGYDNITAVVLEA